MSRKCQRKLYRINQKTICISIQEQTSYISSRTRNKRIYVQTLDARKKHSVKILESFRGKHAYSKQNSFESIWSNQWRREMNMGKASSLMGPTSFLLSLHHRAPSIPYRPLSIPHRPPSFSLFFIAHQAFLFTLQAPSLLSLHLWSPMKLSLHLSMPMKTPHFRVHCLSCSLLNLFRNAFFRRNRRFSWDFTEKTSKTLFSCKRLSQTSSRGWLT